MKRALVAAAVALGGACFAPHASAQAATRLGAAELTALDGSDPVHQRGLATVAGATIGADDVLASLFASNTGLVYAALEQAVRRRVLMLEAARLAVTVAAAKLEVEATRALQAQQDTFKFEVGPDQDFERFVTQRYGIKPDAYRAWIRKEVLEQMLLARTVRYTMRQSERMVCRVIIVKDLENANDLADKLKEGANFAKLAEANSIDQSNVRGGLLAPVPRDTTEPLLKGASALAAGELAPVEPLTNDGTTVYRLLKVEKILPADPRPFAEQESELETELAERPVELLELAEWDRSVRTRYPIELKLADR